MNSNSGNLSEYYDLQSYTSGRWLRQDRQERQARYINFDFNALCRRILELCPGAKSVVSCTKMEGGFNKVFLMTLNNGEKVVARLPFSIAGPAKLTTTSEVSTIKFLQTMTNIPIPKILDWSDDACNPIGSEYIVMEHAPGIQLQAKWPDMDGSQKVRCIVAIYEKLKEMVDLTFPAFGSLYFADTHLHPASRVPLDEKFCIGPHCGARYWGCSPNEPSYYHITGPNYGPWTDLIAFSNGLIDAGLSRVPPDHSEFVIRPYHHESSRSHGSLLENARAVLKQMSEDPRIQGAATPLLYHPDLHKRNIFVSEDDPTVITAIIDWQSASIEPAFWYADEIPDFTLEGETDNTDVLAKTFYVCTQHFTPRLASPRLMDESLFRPFRYSYRTWRDGAVALRNELIETLRLWKDLGIAGSCPYPSPTPTELANHQREYKAFEVAQDLKRDLANFFNCSTDGWVSLEHWEETKSSHKELYELALQSVLEIETPDVDDPVKDEADLKSMWPFDLED